MAAPNPDRKLRCKGCGQYVPRSEMWRVGSVSAICSPQCATKQDKSAKRRAERLQSTLQRPSSNHSGVTQVVVDLVHLRDGGRCRYCGGSDDTHLHHVEYRSEGGPHEDWNLITLCAKHHDFVHANKARWQHVLKWTLIAQYTQGMYFTAPEVERILLRENLR